MIKLLKGNYALVEGAIKAGLEAYFGYPITPQNEITEYMSVRMRQENRVFLQTESELASINMTFGAALAGKIAMTSSSSPGMSLMQEGISYLIGCELPCVLVNVQRGGPGLGNISGAQGDYFQAVKGGGHGDCKMICLTPASVQEMYEMTIKSFYLAFKYRNPVIILSDGIIGQMMEKVELKPLEDVLKRQIKNFNIDEYNAVFDTSDWALTGCKNREPRFIRSLYMDEGELTERNYLLADKYKKMIDELDWEEEFIEDAEVVLVAYGISSRINRDACMLARKAGLKVGCFRLKTAFPFPSERLNEIAKTKKVLVVEMSMGQMVEDVRLAVNGRNTVDFYGVPGGDLPETYVILEKIKSMLMR
jgi:2-oxoglutarate/2-oxoacid ferredoxin oxidoreductase subunit alpha